MWARLQQLVRDVERLFQTYQYGEAGRQIYDFFWSEFADWYVEAAKQQMQEEAHRAQTVNQPGAHPGHLPATAAPLHAFHHRGAVGSPAYGVPRVAVFQACGGLAGGADRRRLARGAPRRSMGRSAKSPTLRCCRRSCGVSAIFAPKRTCTPSRKLPAGLAAGAKASMLRDQTDLLAALAGLDASHLTITESMKKADGDSVALVVGPVDIQLPLAGMVDRACRARSLDEGAGGYTSTDHSPGTTPGGRVRTEGSGMPWWTRNGSG